MAENFYTILTSIGKSKLANSTVLGNKINLKTLQVGDGNGTYHEPSEDQTSLINKVWESDISSISTDESNSNWIVIQTIIPANEGGFYIREAGIFDEDGDLIAVSKVSETYKPVISEGSAKDVSVKIVLEVSNADNVTLKIDPNIVVATKNDIEVLESEIQNINTKILDLEKSKADQSDLDVTNANLMTKANDTDISRTTTSKTVTGAINELDSGKAPLMSPVFTGTPIAPTQVITDNSTKIATTAFINNLLTSIGSNIVFNNDSTYAFRGIKGIMSDNDYWRVGGGGTASDSGYLEIATADNGSEPIYVRQYTGGSQFATIARTLTLLDSSGNTTFPGYVTTPSTVQANKFLADESSTTLGGFSFTVDGAQDTGMFSSGDGIINLFSNGVNSVQIANGSSYTFTVGGNHVARTLSGGYKIQSGTLVSANTNSAIVNTGVTFPSAFSSNPIVIVTPINSVTSSQLGKNYSTSYDYSVYGQNTAGFTLVSNQNGTIVFNWIAIGN